jgi:preprotein translocase SecE subunit
LPANTDWRLALPFTTETVEVVGRGGALIQETWQRYIPILPDVQITVPIVLLALIVWLSWRIVNYPTFADFLIATEAEMNKVSWTTRKRLYQDTIVVLVTVILLTVYLFVVDGIWIKALSTVRVLQIDIQAEQTRLRESSQW